MSSSSNVNLCVTVALFIYASRVLIPVICQESRLNVVFPQLEMLGAASAPKHLQPTPSPPQEKGPDAQKLQKAQTDLTRLKGLLKNLIAEEGSAKNEKIETHSTTAAITPQTTPKITTVATPAPTSAPKPKEIAPNIDSSGIAPFLANLAGVNNAPAEDYDIDTLHNEIEALQKQLINRDDNNSRNTFVNQPVKEAPTAFHFHSEQTPPRQSYFDHMRQDTSNQNYFQDAPKYRSATSEDSVREMEYDYFIHPLAPRPSDVKNSPVHQENTAAGSVYVPNKAGQERFVYRHQKPPQNYDGYNNYASAYGYMPQHFANQYPYPDDSKSQPSEYYKQEVKQEYKVPKNNEKYEELYYANQPNYGPPKQSYGSSYQDYGSPHYGTLKQGHGSLKQEYGTPTQGYGSPNQGYGSPNQGYGTPKQAYGSPNQGYGSSNQGYVQNPQGNKQVAGKQGFHGVILQFILEVVRMIAGGNGSGLIALILRLPGMIVRGILQTLGNSLARDGLRGVIARGIVPTIVLIASNLLIIFMTWFMWDDGSRAGITTTTAETTTQGFLAPFLQNLVGNVGT